MKRLHLCFLGERALFRNMAMPGTDVAEVVTENRSRAIYGLLGNMLGLWRNFDDSSNFGLVPSLEEWIRKHRVAIKKINYPESPEIRSIGQHRHKSTFNYTMPKESGPKNLTYHWNVRMDVEVELSEEGALELIEAVRQPVGTPYFGQSNCLAQVLLMNHDQKSEKT